MTGVREAPWSAVPPRGTALDSEQKAVGVRRLTDTVLPGAFGTAIFHGSRSCRHRRPERDGKPRRSLQISMAWIPHRREAVGPGRRKGGAKALPFPSVVRNPGWPRPKGQRRGRNHGSAPPRTLLLTPGKRRGRLYAWSNWKVGERAEGSWKSAWQSNKVSQKRKRY